MYQQCGVLICDKAEINYYTIKLHNMIGVSEA